MNSILKNWLTTVLGTSVGATLATAMGWTNTDGTINWLAVVVWLLTTIFGAVSKDARVTGGTKPFSQEAESRAADAKADIFAK